MNCVMYIPVGDIVVKLKMLLRGFSVLGRSRIFKAAIGIELGNDKP